MSFLMINAGPPGTRQMHLSEFEFRLFGILPFSEKVEINNSDFRRVVTFIIPANFVFVIIYLHL